MHSTAPDAPPASSHPPLLLAAYVERFLSGRRVAVFGDATSGLGAELVSRGARLVHVYDPDPARVARALITATVRGVTYAAVGDDLGVRDGAFDVVLVADLALFDEPRAVLARARQTLGAHGVLVAATPREPGDGGLGYYEFFDALSLLFPEVKMLGGVPFEGYAVVDFSAEGEPAVSVDTSLAEASAREPSFFLAVASHRPVEVDAYAIVQLPPSTEGARDDARELEDARLQMAEVHARMAATRAELEAMREQRRDAEARAVEERRRVAELTAALSVAEPLSRQHESRAQAEARRAEEVTARLAEAENAISKMAAEVRSRTESASQSIRALQEMQGELRRMQSREQALLRKVAELESEPAGVDPEEHEVLRRHALALAERVSQLESAPQDESHGADVTAAEATLRERAREISALRHEVDRRGALVRELLASLEERSSAGAVPADLEREIENLRRSREEIGARLRQREHDLETTKERVRTLETALRETPPRAAEASAPSAPEGEQVATLRNENDALRRALLQEREARLRAERASPETDPFASVLLEQVKP